jgi:chromosome segregation ATPase
MGGESQGSELEQSLKAATVEFSNNVQEAMSRLTRAAQQFSSLSGRLAEAANEVQSAAQRAEEAQRAAESVQARIERDHTDLTSLMRDLHARIAALAVLAQPLPETPSGSEPVAPASEESPPQPESTSASSWSGSWQAT